MCFLGAWQLGREVSADAIRKQSHEAFWADGSRIGLKVFYLVPVCKMNSRGEKLGSRR